MTQNGEFVSGVSDYSKWDEVAALSGMMGKLGGEVTENRNGVDEKDKIAKIRGYFAEIQRLLDLDADDDAFEELQAGICDDGFLEDDDFINTFLDTPFKYGDEEVVGDIDFLLEMGMPIRKVAENPKCYELSKREHFSFYPGQLSELYDEMAKNGELERFKHDYFENGYYINYSFQDYCNGKKLDGSIEAQAIIKDLRVVKECGKSVLDDPYLERHVVHDDMDMPDYKRSKKLAHDYTADLFEMGFVGEDGLSFLYDGGTESGKLSITQRGALEALLEKGVKPRIDDESGKYWYDLSEKNGKDVFSDYLDGKFKNMDFDNEVAFKAIVGYVSSHNVKMDDFFYDQLGNKASFLQEDLKERENQEYIIGKIDALIRDHFYTHYRDSSRLFALLALDADVLSRLVEQKAFEKYPAICESEDYTNFVSGNYTEKDRMSFFMKHDWRWEKYFDEKGEPNPDFYKRKLDDKITYYLDNDERRKLNIYDYFRDSLDIIIPDSFLQFFDESGPKPEYFDETGPKTEFWRACLENREYQYLAKQDPETRAKMGLSNDELAFLGTLADNSLFARSLGYEDIATFFDESGPKPEFWRACLEKNDYGYLATYNHKTGAKMGFNDGELAFLGTIGNSNFSGNLGYEDIATFFDESGPKPEFWRACLENKDYDFLVNQDDETKARMGFNNLIFQFLDATSSNELKIFGDNGELREDGVFAALTRFIKMDADDWFHAEESDIRIHQLFESDGIKDLALKEIKTVYQKYLDSDNTSFPLELKALADYMHDKNGAGVLTQIEAFLDFAGVLDSAGDEGKRATREIEKKMSDGHWDNLAKTDFYAVSAEVITASPDIYLTFANLLANNELKKDEFKSFAGEIYPLFRAKLALLRKYVDTRHGWLGGGYSGVSYDGVDVDAINEQLHKALLPFNLRELSTEKRREGINIVKGKIRSEISELFQERFGILKKSSTRKYGCA